MGLCPLHRAVGSKCTRHIITAFSLHALCSSLEMTEEVIPCLVRILTTFEVSLKQFIFNSEGTQVAVQFTRFPLGPVEGKEGPITIFGTGTGTRFWSGMWFVTSVIPTPSYVVHHWNSTGAQDLTTPQVALSPLSCHSRVAMERLLTPFSETSAGLRLILN